MEDSLSSPTVNGRSDNGQATWSPVASPHRRLLDYIDEKLHDNLMFIPHYHVESAPVSQSSMPSCRAILANLARLSLEPDSKIHYVSDDNADNVCALKDSDRSSCMAHRTNLGPKKALRLSSPNWTCTARKRKAVLV